jgi:N-acetylneuraminate synthase/N,N'-diacetyllegionaminate synthase
MVKSIRNIEEALSGSGIKEPSTSEFKNIQIARKSIHTNKSLSQGQTLKREDLIMMRPGDGVSPMDIDLFINKQIAKDLPEGHKITKSDILE